MNNYSTVNSRAPRVDAPAKATGTAVYIDDIRLPDMLYGAILHSPLAHAKIVNIDTSRAKKLAGVKSIVTSEKLDVKLPDKLDKRLQRMIDALNEAKPEEFDATYAAQQVKAHGKAVDLFDEYAEGGDNAALKQFAANTLPTIKEHLREARKLTK